MYLDSAIVIKLVVHEPDSLFYGAQVDGQKDVWSSALCLTECFSALLRKEREKNLSENDRRQAWAKIQRYVSEGSLKMAPVNEPIFRIANQILEVCHPGVPLRSLDAIHLACCQWTASWPLLTNDKKMRDAATRMGLPLGNMPD